MAEDGIVTVVCPECGKELCLIKYDSIIYWKITAADIAVY